MATVPKKSSQKSGSQRSQNINKKLSEKPKSINSKNVTQMLKPHLDIISDYKDLEGVPNVNIAQSARPLQKRESQKMSSVALSNRGSQRAAKKKVVNQISLDSKDDIQTIQIEKPPKQSKRSSIKGSVEAPLEKQYKTGTHQLSYQDYKVNELHKLEQAAKKLEQDRLAELRRARDTATDSKDVPFFKRKTYWKVVDDIDKQLDSYEKFLVNKELPMIEKPKVWLKSQRQVQMDKKKQLVAQINKRGTKEDQKQKMQKQIDKLQKLEDLSIQSEIEPNIDTEWAREKSSQMIAKYVARNCINNIEEVYQQRLQEDYMLRDEINVSEAEWYIDKMEGRLERLLAGEELGGMVDSDFEDLLVDYEFEFARQQIEVISDESEIKFTPPESEEEKEVEFFAVRQTSPEKVKILDDGDLEEVLSQPNEVNPRLGMSKSPESARSYAKAQAVILRNCQVQTDTPPKPVPKKLVDKSKVLELQIIPLIRPKSSVEKTMSLKSLTAQNVSIARISNHQFFDQKLQHYPLDEIGPDQMSEIENLLMESEGRFVAVGKKSKSGLGKDAFSDGMSSELNIAEDNEPSIDENGRPRTSDNYLNQDLNYDVMQSNYNKMDEFDYKRHYKHMQDPIYQNQMHGRVKGFVSGILPADKKYIINPDSQNNKATAGRRNLRRSMINVDRSFQIIKDLKQKMVDMGVEDEQFQLKDTTGRLGDKNQLNIEIGKSDQKNKISPARGITEHDETVDMDAKPQFDHSPKANLQIQVNVQQIEDQKKWNQVVDFMATNPQIMMELMPPTPGRKFIMDQTGKSYKTQVNYPVTKAPNFDMLNIINPTPPIEKPSSQSRLLPSVYQTNKSSSVQRTPIGEQAQNPLAKKFQRPQSQINLLSRARNSRSNIQSRVSMRQIPRPNTSILDKAQPRIDSRNFNNLALAKSSHTTNLRKGAYPQPKRENSFMAYSSTHKLLSKQRRPTPQSAMTNATNSQMGAIKLKDFLPIKQQKLQIDKKIFKTQENEIQYIQDQTARVVGDDYKEQSPINKGAKRNAKGFQSQKQLDPFSQQKLMTQNWPKIDESQQLLFSALQEIQDANHEMVQKIYSTEKGYKTNTQNSKENSVSRSPKVKNPFKSNGMAGSHRGELKFVKDGVDRLAPINSDLNNTLNLKDFKEPNMKQFEDFTKGIRESVQRLNPRKMAPVSAKPKKHYKFEIARSRSKSPTSPIAAGPPKKIIHMRKDRNKSSLNHEKRLEKLQKLRKKMAKKHRSPTSQNDKKTKASEQNSQPIISVKHSRQHTKRRQSNQKSDQAHYKILTENKSMLDQGNSITQEGDEELQALNITKNVGITQNEHLIRPKTPDYEETKMDGINKGKQRPLTSIITKGKSNMARKSVQIDESQQMKTDKQHFLSSSSAIDQQSSNTSIKTRQQQINKIQQEDPMLINSQLSSSQHAEKEIMSGGYIRTSTGLVIQTGNLKNLNHEKFTDQQWDRSDYREQNQSQQPQQVQSDNSQYLQNQELYNVRSASSTKTGPEMASYLDNRSNGEPDGTASYFQMKDQKISKEQVRQGSALSQQNPEKSTSVQGNQSQAVDQKLSRPSPVQLKKKQDDEKERAEKLKDQQEFLRQLRNQQKEFLDQLKTYQASNNPEIQTIVENAQKGQIGGIPQAIISSTQRAGVSMFDGPKNMSPKGLDDNRGKYKNPQATAVDPGISAILPAKFDWGRTDFFKHCLEQPRFKRPSPESGLISADREHNMLQKLVLLRKDAGNYQMAHILMPIYQDAMDYIEEVFGEQMQWHGIVDKIRKQYIAIDNQCTVKLLVRARLLSVVKEDLALILCKYLDFMQELKHIQQLRDERASDQLLKYQNLKLQKHGHAFLQRADKFLVDNERLLSDEKQLWISKIEITNEVKGILLKFGLLLKEYQKLDIKDEWID